MSAAAASALELAGVRKSFGKSEIIRGIDLAIAAGERHAIIGPNGAGKSTLFNLVSGRFGVSAGNIRLHGSAITNRKPYRDQPSRAGAQLPDHQHLSPPVGLREPALRGAVVARSPLCLLEEPQPAGRCRGTRRDLLHRVGLRRRRDTLAGLLTYAEQRALEIGITIAGGASVILLDEPTAGMSRAESRHAVDLIRDVTQGRTLVMVEHDMGVVFGLADRISVIVYGQVIASGTPAEIRASAAVQEAYLGQHGGRMSLPGVRARAPRAGSRGSR